MNLLSFPDQNFCINCGLLKDLISIVNSEILCNTCKNDYDNSTLKEILKLSGMLPSEGVKVVLLSIILPIYWNNVPYFAFDLIVLFFGSFFQSIYIHYKNVCLLMLKTPQPLSHMLAQDKVDAQEISGCH